MKAITIEEANSGHAGRFKRPLIDIAVEFINSRIAARLWHNQIAVIPNYYAILIKPRGLVQGIELDVVSIFKAEGWDCMIKSAYDARGPHECFYIHKKHFK